MFGALSIGDSSRLNQQGATTDTTGAHSTSKLFACSVDALCSPARDGICACTAV